MHDFQAPASGLTPSRLIAQLRRDHGIPRDRAGRQAAFFCLPSGKSAQSLRGSCVICQHPVYVCVDRGQLFAYFGWVHPRGRIFWLYALLAGTAAATLVIAILHAEHTPLGHTSPATLLYGVTIGPIIEEILFRGAAFSVIS